MKIISFDPQLIGTGHLFPDEIEKEYGVGYHGTASYYSEDIEAHGFLPKGNPFLPEDFEVLKYYFVKYSGDCAAVSRISSLQSISFSPLSPLCLHYVKPNMLGGQCLQDVKSLIDKVPLNEIGLDLSGVKRKISLIQSSNPVIYAVKLCMMHDKNVVFDYGTAAFHVSADISVDKIIAKIEISDFNDYDSIDVAKLNKIIRSVYYNDNKCYMRQLNPIEDDIDLIPLFAK
jgi:hypothetical protein